jgi:hypothetical protein
VRNAKPQLLYIHSILASTAEQIGYYCHSRRLRNLMQVELTFLHAGFSSASPPHCQWLLLSKGNGMISNHVAARRCWD